MTSSKVNRVNDLTKQFVSVKSVFGCAPPNPEKMFQI
jgi:hypothetical protein